MGSIDGGNIVRHQIYGSGSVFKPKTETKYTKIIAVDFDGTLFTDKWPEIGEPIWPIINKAKREQAAGAAIILWTCRDGEDCDRAVKACMDVGLIPDAVNCNLPERIARFNNDTRKVGADEYWDDRSIHPRDLIEEVGNHEQKCF